MKCDPYENATSDKKILGVDARRGVDAFESVEERISLSLLQSELTRLFVIVYESNL